MRKYLLVALLLSAMNLVWAQDEQPANLTASLQFRFNDNRTDTLTLQVYPQKLGSTRVGAISYQFPVVNGNAEISIPIKNSLYYFHVESKNWPRLWLDNFIAEPGDHVLINVDTTGKTVLENIQGPGLSCRGQGAIKYEAGFHLNNVVEQRSKEMYAAGPPYFLEHMDLKGRWAYYDTSVAAYENKLLKVLAYYEGRMSSLAYATMKADICYTSAQSMMMEWSTEWANAKRSPDSTFIREKLKHMYHAWFTDEKEKQQTSEEGRNVSWAYLEYMVSKTMSQARLNPQFKANEVPEASDYLPVLQSVGKGQFERLATGFIGAILTYSYRVSNPEVLHRRLLQMTKSGAYRNLLEEMQDRFFAKKALYPFELTDSKGAKVKPGDLLGKKLLIDFWFTGCLPCMKVAAKLKELKGYLKDDKSVVFVSICMDQDKSHWLKSVNSEKYSSLDDLNLFTNGLGSQHPLLQYYGISGVPRLLLVDSMGNLQDARVPLFFSNEEIAAIASRIRSLP